MGAERLNGTRDHILEMVLGSVTALREVPEYKDVPIIMAIESQSNDHLYMAHDLMEMEKARNETLLILAEHKCVTGMSHGVPKNQQISSLMPQRTRDMLAMRQVSISKDMIPLTTRCVERRKTARELVSQLEAQLKQYRQDMVTRKYSGKHAGPDDVCIAFQMALFWMTYFCGSERPEYMDFKDQYPLSVWRSVAPSNVAAERLGCRR